MARVSLKNILGKKNDTVSILQVLIDDLDAKIWIEDESGRIVLGKEHDHPLLILPIKLEDEVIGWVKGDNNVKIFAELLIHLSLKEWEKKKLGSEVLNLYQEINLIFNFSEKLAQTIDAPAICAITLDEASHVIKSDNAVIVLWDDTSKRLQVVASSGEQFFNEEKINEQRQFLFSILANGRSEIITDTSVLAENEIILPTVKSLIYSALKVKHRIMGAIVLATDEAVQYTAADLKLLTTLALQSSGAIESALLYEKNIREANEREEAMRRVHEVTGKFVPYEFIGSLGHQVITDIKLGDQVEKIVTVLFSDIRDYTSFSEKMTPAENFRFVCSFNERMGPIIRKNKGFINQYLGDAIMAIFPENASDALRAAVEMQLALEEFNEERRSKEQPPIQIGLGLHTGPLIMGITGDQHRLDATTISDTVNTASRLESLTKYYKSGIIISDNSLRQIEPSEDFHLRQLGLVQLKGKEEPIMIHECFSGNPKEELQNKLLTLSVFNRGMLHYINQSFENANKDFEDVLELDPTDRTAQFFLGKTKQLMVTGNAEKWMSVVEMQEK